MKTIEEMKKVREREKTLAESKRMTIRVRGRVSEDSQYLARDETTTILMELGAERIAVLVAFVPGGLAS
ncbi:hypothetical protein TWF970_009084 [Orbilia oligospora]|uniref:Uncharacterized protein n=1 Tax=Orbilia oligospora TaxID=2813651 RepID=A0A7C8R8D3_ORBOL|nr:hypothetical protein TWF970_009084 [Orbilia oligospora]